MGDEAGALNRDEALGRVRARILAAARARLSPADAEDLTQEALILLSTKYGHVAALDDRALFDALVEEKDLRELLLDPAAWQELLAVLEQPTGWERVRAWSERPATLLDLGAVAALGLVALAGYAMLAFPVAPRVRTPVAARPVGTSLSRQHVAWLLQLPEQQVVPAGIEITGRADAVFVPDEPLHLRISLRAPARVALLEEPLRGQGTQAWPGLGQALALVPSPRAGGPAIHQVFLETPPREGMHRLRLVVAPADLDLGALSPTALPGVAGRLTLVDLRYQVTHP